MGGQAGTSELSTGIHGRLDGHGERGGITSSIGSNFSAGLGVLATTRRVSGFQ
jgi:hypothetical protein